MVSMQAKKNVSEQPRRESADRPVILISPAGSFTFY
jgi:hypothetical protein